MSDYSRKWNPVFVQLRNKVPNDLPYGVSEAPASGERQYYELPLTSLLGDALTSVTNRITLCLFDITSSDKVFAKNISFYDLLGSTNVIGGTSAIHRLEECKQRFVLIQEVIEIQPQEGIQNQSPITIIIIVTLFNLNDRVPEVSSVSRSLLPKSTNRLEASRCPASSRAI